MARTRTAIVTHNAPGSGIHRLAEHFLDALSAKELWVVGIEPAGLYYVDRKPLTDLGHDQVPCVWDGVRGANTILAVLAVDTVGSLIPRMAAAPELNGVKRIYVTVINEAPRIDASWVQTIPAMLGRRFGGWICPSDYALAAIGTPEYAHVVHAPVPAFDRRDLAAEQNDREVRLRGGANVLIVGRGQRKRIAELVRAMPESLGRIVQVTVVSDVPELEDLAKRHNVERVRFPVTPYRMSQIYREHDILINASEAECICLPVMEALARGMGVVTVACGGVLEYVLPNDACRIVPAAWVAGGGHLVRPNVQGRFEPVGGMQAVWQAAIELAEDMCSGAVSGVRLTMFAEAYRRHFSPAVTTTELAMALRSTEIVS